MIFVCVGTQFPFDRLIKALDEAVEHGLIDAAIFAQIGPAEYVPNNFEYTNILDKQTFEQKVQQAAAIISHAGIGSITTALQHNKPLLAIPRLKKFGELVNDHQLGTARKFESLGHILVAYSLDQIPEKIEQLKSFIPQPRKVQPKAVADRISKFLNEQTPSG